MLWIVAGRDVVAVRRIAPMGGVEFGFGMMGAMLSVRRDVSSAMVPIAAFYVDRLGDVCRRAVGRRRNVYRLRDVCRRWRDIGRRAVVDWRFVGDASRAIDAKRRYREKHFSRVVHVAPAFLFTRCEGISLPISDRKRFQLHCINHIVS